VGLNAVLPDPEALKISMTLGYTLKTMRRSPRTQRQKLGKGPTDFFVNFVPFVVEIALA